MRDARTGEPSGVSRRTPFSHAAGRRAGGALLVAAATILSAMAPPGAEGTATAGAPPHREQSSTVPIRAIDIYRTEAFDADWVEAELGDDIRAVIRGDGDEATLDAARQRVRTGLRAQGEFAFLDLSPIQYYGEDGPYIYVTVDVVDATDRDARMGFVDAPAGSHPDPAGLLEAWSEYEQAVFRRLQSGDVQDAGTEGCPAFHCLPGAFAAPELESYGERFEAEVPAHREELVAILRGDADPARRADAAYLLAHTDDGVILADVLIGAIRDPSASVRNSVMRVLGLMIGHDLADDVEIPVGPILEAIDFPATTDRNKALVILAGLAESHPEHHDRIVRESGDVLLALLRLQQPNNHDPAWRVLKAISGQAYGDRDHEAWGRWLSRYRKDGP